MQTWNAAYRENSVRGKTWKLTTLYAVHKGRKFETALIKARVYKRDIGYFMKKRRRIC
jgi:hypothetical protein